MSQNIMFNHIIVSFSGYGKEVTLSMSQIPFYCPLPEHAGILHSQLLLQLEQCCVTSSGQQAMKKQAFLFLSFFFKILGQ